MEQAKHEEFRVEGFVSVWLGNFESEDELDSYLIEGFASDFGFEVYEFDGPEGEVSEAGSLPVRELLEGFSHWHSFVEAAQAEATPQGWAKATTALVFYNFKYDPQFVAPDASGRFAFIGSLPYSVGEE